MSRSARRARRRGRKATTAVEHVARPLHVLLLGRTTRRLDGGLGRSVRMIADCMRKIGNRVELRSCNAPLTDFEADVVWHYGDRGHLDQQYLRATEQGVMFLVNSEFDNTKGRISAAMDMAASHPKAWQVVFTESARRILREAGHRRVVVLPKTIRFLVDRVPFEDREGICIGELAKLRRDRLVRGMPVDAVVAAIRRVVGDEEPVFSYSQYTTPEHKPFEGTTTIPKPKESMGEMLAGLKLFVSLSSHETFFMVPAEAQGVGTPVLYRDMPQSLTEHIGSTGVVFRNAGELEVAVARLLSSKKVWWAYSDSGCHNAVARGVAHAGVAIDMALRKLLYTRSP